MGRRDVVQSASVQHYHDHVPPPSPNPRNPPHTTSCCRYASQVVPQQVVWQGAIVHHNHDRVPPPSPDPRYPPQYGVRKSLLFPVYDSAKYVSRSVRNVMRPPVLSSPIAAGTLAGLAFLGMTAFTLVPMGAVCLAQETFECADK